MPDLANSADEFWSEIDEVLSENDNIEVSDNALQALQGTEQEAYESNLSQLVSLLDEWKSKLETRGFRVDSKVEKKGLQFRYSKGGFYGPGGFDSVLHQRGLLVVGQLTPWCEPRPIYANDPNDNPQLGAGFDEARFKEFLRIDLQRFVSIPNRMLTEKEVQVLRESERQRMLAELDREFEEVERQVNPQRRGFAFEKFLQTMFAFEGLAPRTAFRIVGEQIDGSFRLDHATYLVEAKWEKDPLGEAPLLVFRGKIEGKSTSTRGVFIAINGISAQATEAIRIGKQIRFFVLDSHDLRAVIAGEKSLSNLLRARQRLLEEEGMVFRSAER